MDYLKENPDVHQKEEEGFRRWFANKFFDIIIWYDKPGGGLIGFQLCFMMDKGECTFTWEPGSTGSHFVSNSFVDSSRTNAVPRGHAHAISADVISRLTEEAGDLDDDLLGLILEKINAYNSSEVPQGFFPYM